MSFSFKNNLDKAISNEILSKRIIDELNHELPSGLFYNLIDSSTLVLSSKENMVISAPLLPDNEMLEVLGDNYNLDDIIKLMYNSQRKVAVKTENGKISINNHLIDVDSVVFSIKSKHIGSEFYLLPDKFKDVGPLIINDGKYKLEVPIKRIPNLSLDEIKFEGNSSGFIINLKYNEKTKIANMTYNYDLRKCNSVFEIVECLNLYKNLILGKCTIDNSRLNPNQNIKLNDVDINRLNFWNKVYEIEKKLNLSFKPNFNINGSVYQNVLEIYYSLCEGRILRNKFNINKLQFEKLADKTIKDYEDMNGKIFNFYFYVKKEISLFDCSITLYIYNYLCNVVVTNIVDSGMQFNILFDTRNDSIYAIKYYDNFESLKQPDDEVMKLVNDSKTIEELEEINE